MMRDTYTTEKNDNSRHVRNFAMCWSSITCKKPYNCCHEDNDVAWLTTLDVIVMQIGKLTIHIY